MMFRILKSRFLGSLIGMLLVTIGLISNAAASPVLTGWTRVGHANGGIFNGRCKLDLSGSCTFNDGADFWNALPDANEILFITGDRKTWGLASYAEILGLVQAKSGVFSPNLHWINAGRDGVDLGSTVVGNVLSRTRFAEDPWVTLEGQHCQFSCHEILWGEANYEMPNKHSYLSATHGGMDVYARKLNTVPEPAPATMFGAGLLMLVLARRRF